MLVAGAEGIEPPIKLLESFVMPFNYAPKFPFKNSPARRVIYFFPRKLSGGYLPVSWRHQLRTIFFTLSNIEGILA